MAIYHATVKAFSRGKGHSGTAAAAYRAGIAIADELTGTRHDYTRRSGVASVDMLAPEGAPAWARDPAECFNRSEQAETRANARVGRELEVALPCELDESQRRALAQDLGQLLVDRYQVAVLVAVHKPDGGGDDRNHHVHLLMTPRQIDADGLGARACAEFDARGGAGPAAIAALREAVAERINDHLARASLSERVDHRSLPAQARAAQEANQNAFAAMLAREPTQHEGKTATRMRRRGEDSERGAFNDAVRSANRVELQEYLRRLEAEHRLMKTPPTHSHQQAVQERQQADQAPPATTPQKTTSKATRRERAPSGPIHKRPTRGGGVAKGTRLVSQGMKGADKDYWAEREEAAAARMREAEALGREWLAMLEKSGRDNADWIRGMLERAALVARAGQHYQAKGFLVLATQAREDMRKAAQDDTRWHRRLDGYERSKMAVATAKREQAKGDKADQHPGILCKPATRREWAERRRKRQAKVDKARSRRHDAHQAVEPEAQTKYTRQAQESMQRLERTLSDIQARYPLENDNAHALPQREPPERRPDPRPGPAPENENERSRKRRGAALPPLVPPPRPRP